MSEHKKRLSWLRTRKGIVLLTLFGMTILVAGILGSDAGRIRVLQLAERVGLYQEAEHEQVAVTDEEGNILYWTCTMHPSVRAAEPGKCPL